MNHSSSEVDTSASKVWHERLSRSAGEVSLAQSALDRARKAHHEEVLAAYGEGLEAIQIAELLQTDLSEVQNMLSLAVRGR